MRVAVLASGNGWHARDLRRAACEMGIEMERLDFHGLRGDLGEGGAAAGVSSGGVEVSSFERVIVRSMPAGTLEQVVFRMDAVHRLEAHGVRVVNRPRALETAIDKYLSVSRLASAGLPVPRTIAAETARDALAALDVLGGVAVVKPIFGSEGRGIARLRGGEEALARFAELERSGSVIYLQRFIEHPGHDCRLLVIGGEVLRAMRRHVPDPTAWVTNVAQGGRPEAFDPTPDMRALAIRAAAAVGAEVSGVDILEDRDGRSWVLEVNAVPGWRALALVTGVDVAREVLRHVVET